MDIAKMTTVAEFIEALTNVWANRPRGDQPIEELRKYITREMEIEEQVRLALSIYGACVWQGQVWWAATPPRIGVIGHMPVRAANTLRWTVAGAPVIPEKVGGSIPNSKL